MSALQAGDLKVAKAVETETPVSTELSDATLTKFKTAQAIVQQVTVDLLKLSVEGAKVSELCAKGDELITAATAGVYNKPKGLNKGIAFPVCLSVNNVANNLAPLVEEGAESVVLKKGDVVKMQLGAQIDGYASVHAETFVVGGLDDHKHGRDEALLGAYYAAEVAIRSLRPGVPNKDISKAIQQAVKAYGVNTIDGQFSCAMTQNVYDAKQKLFMHPANSEPCTIEAGQVWGVDVLVTTGSGKGLTQKETRTTVYKKTDVVYQLKLATSRKTLSDIQNKAGQYPFNIRSILNGEDEKRARFGISECEKHGLLTPFAVLHDKPSETVAQFFFTVHVGEHGNTRLSPNPVWWQDNKVTSEKTLDKEQAALVKTALKKKK